MGRSLQGLKQERELGRPGGAATGGGEGTNRARHRYLLSALHFQASLCCADLLSVPEKKRKSAGANEHSEPLTPVGVLTHDRVAFLENLVNENESFKGLNLV